MLVLALVLAACGSAAPGKSSSGAASSAVAPASAPKSGASAGGSTSSAALPDRMVVRNGQMSLIVKNVDAAVQSVRQVARANGGYVRSEQVYVTHEGDQDRPTAEMTIVVRADAFDKARDSLRGLATKVDSETSNAQDVTDQYVDVDANLRNLRASEDELVKLMGKSQNLNEVIALQRELTTVRGQIQQLQARKQLLERQTAMSTIQVSLRLPPVEPADTVWRPLRTVQSAWKSSWVVLRVFADVLISVVVFAWWLFPIIAATVFLYRRQSRARPAAAPAADVSAGSPGPLPT